MDKDKLVKDAQNIDAWETINSSERMSNFYYSLGFIKGAEYLMGQPLTERLTEEESEKIKKFFSESKYFELSYKEMNTFGDNLKDITYYQGRLDAMRYIFGKEFFGDEI